MKKLGLILGLLLAASAFGQTGRFTNVIATNNITAGALTSTRVVFAGTGGLLSGSANFLYNTGTGAFTVNGITFSSASNVTGVNDLTANTLAFTNLTGTVPTANGGFGASVAASSGVPSFASGTLTFAASSTVGQVYRVTGANTFAWGAVNLADTDAVTGALPAANQGGVIPIASFHLDGGGSAITAVTIPGTARIVNACTLTGYSITATGATGTITVTFWVVATGTAIPTIANVINTSGVSLTTGTAVASGTLSDFTDTVFGALDLARCTATAVDGTATDLTVTLYGTLL